MTWKTLFWTLAFSILIFFVMVFLGMKFQWVRALQDKKILENEKVVLKIPKASNPVRSKPELLDEKAPVVATVTADVKDGSSYSLIGEETQLIDFTGMPLELVREECRRISTKVGVPKERFNQSVNECVTRNFQGKIADNVARSRNVQTNLRKQCKRTLSSEQQALFSPEEMKLIIDECVVDFHKKKNAAEVK